jgi:hypothetical protein
MTKNQGKRQQSSDLSLEKGTQRASKQAAPARKSDLDLASHPNEPDIGKAKSVPVFMSVEVESRLKAILRQASPFIVPLSLTQLVDLIFCELFPSNIFIERAASHIDGYDLGAKDKRTTMMVKEPIDDFLTETFGICSHQVFTKLVRWVVSDWDWIFPRLSFKGLRKPIDEHNPDLLRVGSSHNGQTGVGSGSDSGTQALGAVRRQRIRKVALDIEKNCLSISIPIEQIALSVGMSLEELSKLQEQSR